MEDDDDNNYYDNPYQDDPWQADGDPWAHRPEDAGGIDEESEHEERSGTGESQKSETSKNSDRKKYPRGGIPRVPTTDGVQDENDPKKFASFVETFIFFASRRQCRRVVTTIVGTRRAIAFTLSLFSHGHWNMEKVYCGGIRMDIPF